MKKITALALCAALIMTCGCAAEPQPSPQEQTVVQNRENQIAAAGNASSPGSENAAVSEEDMFSNRDRETDYDESECVVITLADSGITATGNAVTIAGSTVTLSQEGDYILRGSLTDGQIIVDAAKDAKLRIILDGASIACSDSAPLYIKQADKVFVTLTPGSENSLAVTGDYVQTDDNNVDAAVFSKEDITLNGSGSLAITAAYGHGIVSKDDLKLTGGNYTIEAADHGLSGKDCVCIAAGNYTIKAATDAIHSENNDDATQGYIYVSGGAFAIECGSDAIDASAWFHVDGGDFTIDAQDDALHAEGDAVVNAGTINVVRCKEGIEGKSVAINGGVISLNATDDGLNATDGSSTNSERDQGSEVCITINGGELNIVAGADGVDSNGSIVVNGGVTMVSCPDMGVEVPMDYNGSAAANGGAFLAAGGSGNGMSQGFGSDSAQPSILYVLPNTQDAGAQLALKDAQGQVVAAFTPPQAYSLVQVSLPQLAVGQTYILCVGEEEYPIELTEMTYANMQSFGGMMPGGRGGKDRGGWGGTRPDGQMPEDWGGQMPEGMEFPERPEGWNGQMPEGMEPPAMPENGQMPQMPAMPDGTPPVISAE